LVTRAIIVASLFGVVGTAAAQPAPAQQVDGPGSYAWYVPPPEPPPPVHRFQVSLGGSLRFTNLDVHDGASKEQLLDYGWPSARSPVMPGLGGDVAFLLAPIIDLGIAASWAKGDHAAGLDHMNDRVSTTTHRFSAIARVHYAMGRPFIPEPRIEIGVMRRSVRLHGVTASDSVPFVRAAIDWRLGNRIGGAQLSAGYTITGRASSTELDPAVGGLDVSIGPYLRF
jgi:hypothetical protein